MSTTSFCSPCASLEYMFFPIANTRTPGEQRPPEKLSLTWVVKCAPHRRYIYINEKRAVQVLSSFEREAVHQGASRSSRTRRWPSGPVV